MVPRLKLGICVIKYGFTVRFSEKTAIFAVYFKEKEEGGQGFLFYLEQKMDALNKVQELLQPLLDEGNYYLVDLSLSPSRRQPTLTVLVDTDEGISIDQCAKISRQLAAALEAEEVFETAYNLEVSSPGVDTPLKTERQYQKNIGRTIKFGTVSGESFNAKLLNICENTLEMQQEVSKGRLKTWKKESSFLPISEVKIALVQVTFS
jgi:ribosome maturation factor RimP